MQKLLKLLNNKQQLLQYLPEFNLQFKDTLDLSEEKSFTIESNEETITALLKIIKSDNDLSDENVLNILNGFKVITRVRKGTSELAKPENVDFFINLTLKSVDKNSIEIADQSLRVLGNVCYLHQATTLPFLRKKKYHEPLLKVFETQNASNLRFSICRLIFFVCIDRQFAHSLATNPIFEVMIGAFLFATNGEYYKDVETNRLVCEILKVLFLLHPENPYKGDRSHLLKRIADILKVPLLEKINENDNEGKKPYEVVGEDKKNILQVKLNIINLLWTEKEIPPKSISEDLDVLNGLLELLDIQAHCDTKPEAALSPLLFVFRGLVSTSVVSIKTVKTYIFGKYAFSNAGQVMDKDSQMHPIGKSEDAPDSTKSLLIKHITSFSMTLKSAASEFFYALAARDSQEYIRLVGFGNAAGLMAEKGMPGFASMSQNAMNLGDLLSKGSQK